MDLLAFLFIGLLAGWIAGKLMQGRGFGILGDIIVGVVGAFIGGLLLRSLGITVYGALGALAMSVIGAVILLFFVGLIRRV